MPALGAFAPKKTGSYPGIAAGLTGHAYLSFLFPFLLLFFFITLPGSTFTSLLYTVAVSRFIGFSSYSFNSFVARDAISKTRRLVGGTNV